MTSDSRPAVDVLYVSTSPSPAEFARISQAEAPGGQRIVYGLPEASFKFHNLLREGFAHDHDVRVHSLVGRPISPATHSGRRWRQTVEDIGTNYRIVHVGLLNAPMVKQVSAAVGCAARAVAWRWRTRKTETRIVVIDGAYVSVMPAVLMALAGSSVTRVGIFCDLYSYMADVTDAAGRRVGLAHSALRWLTRVTTSRLQVFVLLTEAMAQVLPTVGRSTLVMEGLVDHRTPKTTVTRDATPTVLYAGALREEYGLRDLVQGFSALDAPDARLVVYGRGDFSRELEQAATDDPRIEYRGAVGLDEVFDQERRAWLLVNPRPVQQEFTKYSFPSKTMEYLASGTPVLSTPLPGMPDEYYEFVWTTQRPGADALTAGIRSALAHTPAEIAERGAAGQAFVVDHKNNVVQARRIVDRAREISERA